MDDAGVTGAPAEGRLRFLFAAGAPMAFGPLMASGGPLHRLLAMLSAVAESHLVHERGVDDVLAAAFRKALRDPSVGSSAHLLETLLSTRKVRASDLLGVVPADSPRAQTLATDLRDLLRAVATEAQEEPRPVDATPAREDRPGEPGAPPERADEGRASSRLTACDVLLEFLARNLDGELLVQADPVGPRTLMAASRPGPDPGPGESVALRRRDATRQPLHPFMQAEIQGVRGPWVLWDFEAGRLRFQRCDGTDLRELPADQAPDFWLEMLLQMGAHPEVREWLKALPEGVRDGLNRRNVLYAGSCHYGALYLRQREFQSAAAELERAVKVRPDLLLAHLLLAQAAMGLRQVERAMDMLKRHAVLFNRSDRIFELLGDCLRSRKDEAGALRMYDRAALLNPLNRQVERKRDLVREEARKEREARAAAPGVAPAGQPTPPVRLEDFVVDMTAEAEAGGYSPTVGRDGELRQLVEILSCRDKRNPLLLGDPGVGKTALVEDFVLRLVQRRLSPRFLTKKVYLLSVGTLFAGAKFRGQFEERVLEVVRLLKAQDCILFIDNIHAIVNAGMTRGGTLDTSSLLKPFLVRGEIQVIGATNFDEYRNNLERDASLSRCFQVIQLEEPSLPAATEMVLAVRSRYEAHHHVRLAEDVVRATMPVIDTSVRERALPDKALDVYDRASAVAALRRAEAPGEGDTTELSADDVLGVLSEMTRVPVSRLSEDARSRLARMEETLAERVVGQPEAVARVSRVLRAAWLQLRLDPRRPRGVFLFVGPTGVGKTELARALAEVLFGSEDHLIRIDMSEYMERINQSRLIGTAPGYVGYNDQNQLTDEVRKSPHSLVLLDEIEKASHEMIHLFLQVFDAGRLTDGKGRTVHFDQTTLVMTSNCGTHLYGKSALGFEEGRGGRAEVSTSDLMREVRRQFPPEFLNRIDEIIGFEPLGQDEVRHIARLKVARVAERLGSAGKRLDLAEDVLDLVASQGFSPDEGARNLERTVRRLLLEPMASRALTPEWERTGVVRVAARDGELTFDLSPDEGGDLLEVTEAEDAAGPPLESDDRA